MAERIYCMIIGDVVNSKKIDRQDRYVLQIKLKKALNKINFLYDKYICSRFCITLGDEFQGGLYSSYPLFEILENIKSAIKPYKIRVGIGIGAMSTDIKYSDSLGSDGPAYYYARNAIEKIKKNTTYEYGYYLDSYQPDDNLINNLFTIIDEYSSQWTEKQKDYILSLNKKENLESIASRKGVSVSTASRTLKRAKYNEITKILEVIREYIFNKHYIGENQDAFMSGYNKACSLVEIREYEAALDAIKPPDRDKPCDNIIYNMILSYIYGEFKSERNKLEAALKYAEKAYAGIYYDYRYKKIIILNYMGMIYKDMGEKEAALKKYEEALKILEYEEYLKPELMYILGNKAILYSDMGKYAEADQIYERIWNTLKSEYENDFEQQLKLLNNRADNLIKLGDKEKAENILNTAMEIADSYIDRNSFIIAALKFTYAEFLIKWDLSMEKALSSLNESKEIYKKNKLISDVNECDELISKISGGL